MASPGSFVIRRPGLALLAVLVLGQVVGCNGSRDELTSPFDVASGEPLELTPIIETQAGNGTPGLSGDGGPAVNAQLSMARGVAVDPAGNIFIADTANHRIRRIDAVDGTISTIAGTTQGFAGDGGPATGASLDTPSDVEVDEVGYVFIADTGNDAIRRISPDGTIQTICGGFVPGIGGGDGGPAIFASVFAPTGIALDRGGSLYIAEQGNNAIRRIDVYTGIITTVAGGGFGKKKPLGGLGADGDFGPAEFATLNAPTDIALDEFGGFYIADTGHHRVRYVDGRNGLIFPFAGDGIQGSAVGPAESAQLDSPSGVVVTSDDVVYISDRGNHMIRKVEFDDQQKSTVLSTFAGTGTPGLDGEGGPALLAALDTPAGLALDRRGRLFVAEEGSSRVRRVHNLEPLQIEDSLLAYSEPGFTYLAEISAIGGCGGGYVWSVSSGELPPGLELCGCEETVFVQGIPTTAGDFSFTIEVLDGDGNIDGRGFSIRVTDAFINTVAGDGTDGFGGDDGPATMAQISFTVGLAMDDTGSFLIGDEGNFRVRGVSSFDSTISTVVGVGGGGSMGDGGPAIFADIGAPYGLDVDRLGGFILSDQFNGNVRAVDEFGIIQTIAGFGGGGKGPPGPPGPPQPPKPFGNGDGGPAIGAFLTAPWGVARDPSGNVYIVDAADSVIRRVDALTGIIDTIAGTGFIGFSGDGGPADQADLNFPTGIALHRDGSLYFCDTDNRRVRRIDLRTGIIETVAGNGIPLPPPGKGGGAPPIVEGSLATEVDVGTVIDVKVDRAGNLYLAALDLEQILKVDATTGAIFVLAGDGVGGFGGDGGPADAASLLTPAGLAVDFQTGEVIVADRDNFRIRRIGDQP